MDEGREHLEREKLRLETEKLQRDIDLNIESKKLSIEENRIESDGKRQKREHIRSIVALALTALSIIITGVLTYGSFQTNKEINSATLEVNRETLRQKKLERIDKLQTEYEGDLTSRDRKASIAHELMNIGDTTLIPRRDRDRYSAFYAAFYAAISAKETLSDNSNKKIQNLEPTINANEIQKLQKAEEKQVLLENKLSSTKDPTLRKEIANQIIDISKTTSPVGKLVDTVGLAQLAITSIEKESVSLQPKVTWFKEGYYRPFGDLIVALVELDYRNSRGVVKISGNDNGDQSKEITRISFSVPGKKTFSHKNQLYEIDFIKIDRAGKNPFTKAVYFSFVRLNKNSQRTFDSSFDDTFR